MTASVRLSGNVNNSRDFHLPSHVHHPQSLVPSTMSAYTNARSFTIRSDQAGIVKTETCKLLCSDSVTTGRLPFFLFLHNVFLLAFPLIQNAMHGGSTPTPLTTRNDSIAIDTLDELFYFGATNGLLMMQLLFLFCLPLVFHLGG